MGSLDYSIKKEYIQVNDFGAYSYSTIIGLNTRKYHGLLAVPQPQIDQDQHVLLSNLIEDVKIDQTTYELGIQKYPGVYVPNGSKFIMSIEIDPIPKITYNIDGTLFTKEVLLLKNKNTVLIRYTLVDGVSQIQLKLKPFLAFKNKHTLSKSNAILNNNYEEAENGVCFKLYNPYDTLYIQISSKNQRFTASPDWYYNLNIPKKMKGAMTIAKIFGCPAIFKPI